MPSFNLEAYETVEERLAKFWAEHAHGRVTTEMLFNDEGRFIVKAYLFREGEDVAFGTGLAEELVGVGHVNKTSALENCETSAVGRALANAGYAPMGARPSREEMEKVQRRERQDHGELGELDSPPGSEVKPQRHSKSVSSGGGGEDTRLATEKQRGLIRGKLKDKGIPYPDKALAPDGWAEAGLPPLNNSFPFSAVNAALGFIEKLEPVNA